MKRFLITTVLLTIGTLGFAPSAHADHSAATRAIRRDYDLQKLELEHDFGAHKDALRYAYHRERDALLAARKVASRIDCHETRKLRVRALNRELSNVSRDYSVQTRELSASFAAQKAALRSSYEFALNRAKRAVVARPVVIETVSNRGVHPADCGCATCRVPVGAVAPPIPRPLHGYSDHARGVDVRTNRSIVERGGAYDGRGRTYGNYGYGYERPVERIRHETTHSRHRGNSGLNWAGLILNLLAN